LGAILILKAKGTAEDIADELFKERVQIFSSPAVRTTQSEISRGSVVLPLRRALLIEATVGRNNELDIGFKEREAAVAELILSVFWEQVTYFRSINCCLPVLVIFLGITGDGETAEDSRKRLETRGMTGPKVDVDARPSLDSVQLPLRRSDCRLETTLGGTSLEAAWLETLVSDKAGIVNWISFEKEKRHEFFSVALQCRRCCYARSLRSIPEQPFNTTFAMFSFHILTF
jgi:hypothetical protein